MRFQDRSIGTKLIVLTVPLIAVVTLVTAVLLYKRDIGKVLRR